MTDRSQFEAMLNALLSENQEEAKEIFHNIVVAKSREIYEELLAEDFDISEESEEDEDEEKEVDETYEEDDVEEAFGDDEDDSSDDEVGGDASDDFIDDTEEEDETDFGGEEEGEGDIEDRVMDLEDALEELKAEFEELMAGEENEPEHADMFGGEEPEMGGEEPEMGGDEFGAEPELDEFSMFMEYVNKVALPKHGDDGANTKSIVAKKNDMGGTTANIVKGGEAKGEGTKGGLLNPSTKEENFGNVNVPGGNAGKSAFKKKEPGHGAEKKGSGESAPNKKSIIGSSK